MNAPFVEKKSLMKLILPTVQCSLMELFDQFLQLRIICILPVELSGPRGLHSANSLNGEDSLLLDGLLLLLVVLWCLSWFIF